MQLLHTVPCWIATSALLVAPVTLLAQQDRIVVPIEPGRTVVLTGNVSPKARPQFDQGPVDPSLKLDLLTLVLKPTPQQQAALEQLLIEQQGRSSANYHRWLSPLEYAGRFGLSQNDIGKAKAWLESQGFAVSYVSHGRNWITLQVTIRI